MPTDVFLGAIGGANQTYPTADPNIGNVWFDGDDHTVGSTFGVGAHTVVYWDAGQEVTIDSILIKWSYGTEHPGFGAAGGCTIWGNHLPPLIGPGDWVEVLTDTDAVTTAGASFPGDFEHEYTLGSPATYRYWKWQNIS